MIEKFISPGDKLEMRSTVEVLLPDGTEGIKLYKTKIYDICEDGRLEIVMPMEQTRLVLLPVDGIYDVCFFSHGGMYKADVRIVDRQKINGIYILVAEMITNLRKHQRREYYRFNCIIGMWTRQMTPQETFSLMEHGIIGELTDGALSRGVIVDISGGGLRFVSRELFQQDSLLFANFKLTIAEETKEFTLAAKVIYSKEIENRESEYENRLKFVYIKDSEREDIIKYIFEEERRCRKNSRGMVEE